MEIPKGNKKYKTIGEVAKLLNLINKKNGSLSTHTIRFWEKNLSRLNQRYLQEKEDIMIWKPLISYIKLNIC